MAKPSPQRHPARDRAAVRTMVLAMIGLTLFVIAMIASYSGAFAKPTLHHLTVAVAGPEQVVDGIRGQEALAVNEVGDDAAARRQVYERKTDAAFVVAPAEDLRRGRRRTSVANAAETVGRAVAAKAGLTPAVEDVARRRPRIRRAPSSSTPSSSSRSARPSGATVFGRLMGKVRKPPTLALRTLTLAGYSALLAGAVTVYVDVMLGALTGHTWQVFGALWLYAMAVGGAVTGVAAAFGSVASMVLTLFLVVVGNAAAAGPVGRPLLSGFYSTFNAIVPQGSGVALLRSISYFGGNGAQTPLVTLAIWGAAGCLLAVVATASRVNYRALYERFLPGRRARPSRTTTSAPITGRLTRRRRRRRSGSTAGMVWAYAFNHEEAIRCFERALELDPDLAIARWGIAYSIGPNYNKAWEAFDPVDLAASLARARMELGLAADGRASAVERGLIEALQARFPTDDPNDADALQAGHAAYADAMVALAEAYPDDIDVQALAADALVNVTAWALWDTRHRRAGAGLAGGGGQADPRRRAGHARRPRTSRCPAPVPARHGDVGHPAGRAARRRPAARPGARRRPSAAHAQPHRRAVR